MKHQATMDVTIHKKRSGEGLAPKMTLFILVKVRPIWLLFLLPWVVCVYDSSCTLAICLRSQLCIDDRCTHEGDGWTSTRAVRTEPAPLMRGLDEIAGSIGDPHLISSHL